MGGTGGGVGEAGRACAGARRAHGHRPHWALGAHTCPSAGDPLGPVQLERVRPRPALGLLEGPTQDGPSTHLLGGEGVSTSVWKTLVRCAIRSLSRMFPELRDVSVRIRDFAPEILSLTAAFFIVQLSHQYMTTGKTTVLTVWTFVSKVMYLLFNMLSRFVIVFLPRSMCI